MIDFLQFVINGLAKGSVYSLLALGLVVIYRGTGHLNFAQGEMALFATFGTLWFYNLGLQLWVALIITSVLAFVGGGAIEYGLMRPAGKKSPLAVVVVAIGLFQGLNALTGLVYKGSGNGLNFPAIFPSKSTDFYRIGGTCKGSVCTGGVIWYYHDLGTLLLALALTALLFLLFQKTKVGLAMRMVASNPDSAKLVGVSTNRILMMSWGLASALGVVGGAAFASLTGIVSLVSMFQVFLLASAAATLGGLDSPIGAVVGGLSLGVMESLVQNYPKHWKFSAYIGGSTATAVAFVIILVVLLVKPSGLFGSSRVERV